MLVLSWVKETAEFVRYEALFLVHPFVNSFHKYCTLPGHCACRYATDLLPFMVGVQVSGTENR